MLFRSCSDAAVPRGRSSCIWWGGVAGWRGGPLVIRVRAMPINILITFKHEELIYDIEIFFPQSGIYRFVPFMKFQAIDSSLPQVILTLRSIALPHRSSSALFNICLLPSTSTYYHQHFKAISQYEVYHSQQWQARPFCSRHHTTQPHFSPPFHRDRKSVV